MGRQIVLPPNDFLETDSRNRNFVHTTSYARPSMGVRWVVGCQAWELSPPLKHLAPPSKELWWLRLSFIVVRPVTYLRIWFWGGGRMATLNQQLFWFGERAQLNKVNRNFQFWGEEASMQNHYFIWLQGGVWLKVPLCMRMGRTLHNHPVSHAVC